MRAPMTAFSHPSLLPCSTSFSSISTNKCFFIYNNNSNNFYNFHFPTKHSNFTFTSSHSSICFASLSEMDTTGQGLYPLHRCKTLHLLRHAQGFHNLVGAEDSLSDDYLDASLTPHGWKQVDSLKKHAQATGLSKKIELVIVSPLMRTMQTAAGAFGGGGYTDGIDVTPLMVADAGNSGRPAISSLNCPPFVAVELCREHVGVFPSDKRRNKGEYESLFPAIDFSLIESDEDILWKENVRESNEEVAARGLKFLKWLWTRKEKEIAIVSHGGFLFNTLSAFGNDCHDFVKSEICTPFANCGLRSMVFVDKGMLSSNSPATNFPGKVPSGADLPSDVADGKA